MSFDEYWSKQDNANSFEKMICKEAYKAGQRSVVTNLWPSEEIFVNEWPAYYENAQEVIDWLKEYLQKKLSREVEE